MSFTHRRFGPVLTTLMFLVLSGPQESLFLTAIDLVQSLGEDCPTVMCTSRACCCTPRGEAGRCSVGPAPCTSPAPVLAAYAKGLLPPEAPDGLAPTVWAPVGDISSGAARSGFGWRFDPPPRSFL